MNRPRGYWWGATTFAGLTGWMVGTAWSEPVYYTYGTGGNVYYEGDTVYVEGSPVSSQTYYDQAVTLAKAAPEVTEEQAEQIEWKPLGVFAIAAEDAEKSYRYLQLAVSKDGVIAGTFYNELTDTTRPIEGTVDKETQRAAFTFADGENTEIVMETTLGNLSQEDSTALVHFGDVMTQTWLLVRLPDPESEESNS
ncbi:hypothetical protein [Stratiformator vulcanicus]|uniref:hypothetical protein n=1 Tax=Stratiformator vulcanicus TaxID=2527980 RepID=UPI0011A4EF4F|nr:hypothetical protein [Stratiformator vulcanicus]